MFLLKSELADKHMNDESSNKYTNKIYKLADNWSLLTDWILQWCLKLSASDEYFLCFSWKCCGSDFQTQIRFTVVSMGSRDGDEC